MRKDMWDSKRIQIGAALVGLLLLSGCAIKEINDCLRNPLSCVGPVPQASPTPAPSATPTAPPSVEPSLPPPPPPASPSPEATPTPSPVPVPTPCAAAPQPSPKPECRTYLDGLPAPDCDKCRVWVGGQLAGGHLESCQDGKPGPCAGAKDRAYNSLGGGARECVNTKNCDLVDCATGDLRAHRYQRDGSVCYPEDCTKEPQVAPTPCPSPTPVPSPTPSPSGAPPLTESGNFPVDYLARECRAGRIDPVTEVGISVLTQRKCAGRDAPPDCTLTVLSATEKSVKPYCEHSCYDEAGRYALGNCRLKCETLRECQQPEFVNGNSGIQMLISSPEWGNVFGDCDKTTAEGTFPDNRRNFLCHDRAENRAGVTQAKACEPTGSKCGPTITFRSLP